MAILMLEIVLGGASGHWTTIAGPVSGRVLLEVLLMLRVVVVLVRERSRVQQLLGRYGLHALAVAVLLPALWMALGVARGNTLSNVFGDGNGIALFSLAIAFELLLREGWGRWIRGWFFVCLVANAIVTGALVLVSRVGIVSLATLSHVLVDKLALGNVVGYMPNGAYRLYLANSLFLPIVIAFTSYKLLARPRAPWLWALFALASADVIATYTRGVWVSAALVFLLVLVLGARHATDAIPFLGGTAALFITAVVVGQVSGSSLIGYVFTRTSSITQVTPTGSKAPHYPSAPANRNFEGGVRSWTATGGSEASVTTSHPFRGLRSLRLTESSGATDAYVAQTVGVRPRTKYLVTAHYRPIGVSKLVAPLRGLLLWDIQGGQVLDATIVRQPGWHRIAAEIRTGPATHALEVRLYAGRPAIDWDAVSVARLTRRTQPPAGTVVGPLTRIAPTVLPAPGGSASSDTAGAASNAIRVEQAKILFHHIEHSPLFGYGFGTIASDYPYGHTYSYELSYLDIAYKTGIVGLLFLLSFPFRLLVDAVRVRLGRLKPAAGVVPYDAALVVVMIGTVLVTAIGNPVIEASYGVLPIVATVAWLDGDETTE
jgi:hypothetical protein